MQNEYAANRAMHRSEYNANAELAKSICHHRYIDTPKPERSSLAWFVLALTIAAMCGIGLVLVRAVVLWLASGNLM